MGFSDIHIQNLDNSSQQRSTNAKLPPENSDKDLNSVQKPDQEILESIEPIYFSEGEDVQRYEIEVNIGNKQFSLSHTVFMFSLYFRNFSKLVTNLIVERSKNP